MRVCHCRLCQRATGGPFFARAVFLDSVFERWGATTSWPSSPRIERQSCAGCGTPMFAVPKDAPARIGVSLATLDAPETLRPDCHIWVAAKLPWVAIDDGLPRYEEGVTPTPA